MKELRLRVLSRFGQERLRHPGQGRRNTRIGRVGREASPQGLSLLDCTERMRQEGEMKREICDDGNDSDLLGVDRTAARS